MAVYHRKPKILSHKDMFLAWTANLRKEKPHLIVKKGRLKATELWYEVKEELSYLETKNLNLDIQLQELEKKDKEIDRFTAVTEQIFEIRKEIMQNSHKIKELRKLPGNEKEMIINSDQFKAILSTYNKKASEEIIQGHNLNLGNRLGYIQIRKIIPEKRSVGRIDWKASMEYRKELQDAGHEVKNKTAPEGKNWLVYRQQSFYLRWAWVKRYNRACTVKNNRVYAFIPTASSSSTGNHGKILGNKTKLVQAQLTNPVLHTKYTVVKLAGRDSTVIINP